VGPDGAAAIRENFQCSQTNFGVNKYGLDKLAQEGRWTFLLTSHEDYASVSIKVESKSRSTSTDPIITKCWVATGSQALNTGVDVKIAVVAEVSQGSKPVLGATVVAEVEIPTGVDPPITFSLSDNGSGADKIKNDGIYSRYFADYKGSGRFSVKCQVQGDRYTSANGGYTGGRRVKVYPQEHQPGNPLCCGSNALLPGDTLVSTGNFSRQAAGGSFHASSSGQDRTPPVRVTDLTVEIVREDFVQVNFTAPGDDLDSDNPAKEYVLKYSSTDNNLTADNFDNSLFNTEITQDDLINSTLTPVSGGTRVSIKIKLDIFDYNVNHALALRSQDDAGNTSPVSNIGHLYRQRTILPHCPRDFFHINSDSCLYFHVEQPHKDFVESMISCSQIGGFLAEPTTAEELQMMLEHGQSVEEVHGIQNWWIGLSDFVSEGDWRWITGNISASLPADLWAQGRPDTEPGNRADCVFTSLEHSEVRLYDTECTATEYDTVGLAPLCQCKADQCRSLTPACPRDFIQTHTMDCLKVITKEEEGTDFVESLLSCHDLGGFLAEPKSEEEAAELLSSLQSLQHNQPLWIGLTDFYSEGSWTWVESGEVASTGVLEKHWAPGRPAIAPGNTDDCVVAGVVGDHLQITDTDCAAHTMAGQGIGTVCQCRPGQCRGI